MGLGAKGQAEDRECCQPAELRHYAKITSQSAAVAHALLRSASSLPRRLRALEQRASAKVPTRHARVRAPRPPGVQCEVTLASALRPKRYATTREVAGGEVNASRHQRRRLPRERYERISVVSSDRRSRTDVLRSFAMPR